MAVRTKKIIPAALLSTKYHATWMRQKREQVRLSAEAGDPEAIAQMDRKREQTRAYMREYYKRKKAGLVKQRPRQSEVMSTLWADRDFQAKTMKARRRKRTLTPD